MRCISFSVLEMALRQVLGLVPGMVLQLVLELVVGLMLELVLQLVLEPVLVLVMVMVLVLVLVLVLDALLPSGQLRVAGKELGTHASKRVRRAGGRGGSKGRGRSRRGRRGGGGRRTSGGGGKGEGEREERREGESPLRKMMGRLTSGCLSLARAFRAAPSGVADGAAGAEGSCGLPSLTVGWRLGIDLPAPCRLCRVPPGGGAWAVRSPVLWDGGPSAVGLAICTRDPT